MIVAAQAVKPVTNTQNVVLLVNLGTPKLQKRTHINVRRCTQYLQHCRGYAESAWPSDVHCGNVSPDTATIFEISFEAARHIPRDREGVCFCRPTKGE